MGHGFYRISAISPPVTIADPSANGDASLRAVLAASQSESPDLIVLPELGLTGYTCGDLFLTQRLLDAAETSLVELADQTSDVDAIVVVGLPLRVRTAVMNVAAVLTRGRICGIVPKTFLPNYREFYEQRHFEASSPRDPGSVGLRGADGNIRQFAFGTDLLFQDGTATIGVEICEDLWVPIPPSCHAAMAGANVIANLSASNELIGKAHWRRELVRSQSGRLIAAYAYASAGPGESSSDLVFGGHNVIAENGVVLGQSRRVGDGGGPLPDDGQGGVTTSITCDVDLQRLDHDRRVIGSFNDGRPDSGPPFRRVDCGRQPSRPAPVHLRRHIDAHPFVPDDESMREARCAEVLEIQTNGLAKRLSCVAESSPLSIGISGGLDSTLALIVAVRAVDQVKRPRSIIHGMVMPGFGTSDHTRRSAKELVTAMGVTEDEVDIRRLCLDAFSQLNHAPLGIDLDEAADVAAWQRAMEAVDDDVRDLVFENVQARMRTLLLMNRGFVLGTGDLSEQALGWSTYNADHMSMYNVNASIPKTLVRYLVRFAADHLFDSSMRELLHRIADTPISPELLPLSKDGKIRQDTEASVGPYELHDFFLYHFVRGGCDRDKMLYLAKQAQFHQPHSVEIIEQTLDTFLRRFFANQFKRNCVPDGPKVGSVSLSPRGDWRMPADAGGDAFQ
ncbi:MAG: NAD(+) synthase [Planctomycetota bacterium]